MLNYFELFAIPTAFDIDLQHLSKNYQELQKLTHPDRFAGQSEQQQRVAIQKNSQVNDGFQVLKSPVRRAEHILALRGIDMANETQTMQDMEFLMQQMHWREALEDSEQANEPQRVIEELLDEVEAAQKHTKAQIAEQLLANTSSADHAVADEIRKLKFMDKMQSEIAEMEERLFS